MNPESQGADMTTKIKSKDDSLSTNIIGCIPGKTLKEESDLIVATAFKIENLSKDQAYQQVEKISHGRGAMAFCLGGVLSVIKSNNWHTQDGYTNFGKFVEEVFGLARSTAYDYVSIYENIINTGVPWKELEPIGWTKIRLFARYLNKDNADDWIEVAKQMNASELRDYVKSELIEQQGLLTSCSMSTHVDTGSLGHPLIPPEAQEASLIRINFQIFASHKELVDEAVDAAMKELGTTHKGQALSNICLHFLNSYVFENLQVKD